MSHMVIYRGSDGKPGYHQTDDIHDAVGFVEQMRNDQGVEHARIFRLEEVVFQYKPYYRVELAESGFVELGGGADTGAGNSSTNGSASLDLTAEAGAGGTEPSNGGNGSSDEPAPATAGSPPPSSGSTATTSADDSGGSKRGLFGR